MTRVWRAEPDEAATVAGLLGEFRDWLGRSLPSDESFAAGVARLIEEPDTEYLLASADPGRAPRRRLPDPLSVPGLARRE